MLSIVCIQPRCRCKMCLSYAIWHGQLILAELHPQGIARSDTVGNFWRHHIQQLEQQTRSQSNKQKNECTFYNVYILAYDIINGANFASHSASSYSTDCQSELSWSRPFIRQQVKSRDVCSEHYFTVIAMDTRDTSCKSFYVPLTVFSVL